MSRHQQTLLNTKDVMWVKPSHPNSLRQAKGRHITRQTITRRGLLLLGAIALSISLMLGAIGLSPSSTAVAQAQSQPEAILQNSLEQINDEAVDGALTPVLELTGMKPAYLDGRVVFSVADANGISASARAKLISQRLEAIAQKTDQPQVEWSEESESQLPIITVNGNVLMTVTEADARLAGLPQPSLLASELEASLTTALQRYQQERRPDYLRRQLKFVALSVALLLTASFGLTRWQARLRHKLQHADEHGIDFDKVAAPTTPREALRSLSERQSRNFIVFQGWCGRIAHAFLWGGGIWYVMSLFPYTRQWQPRIFQTLGVPLKIAAIALTIYGLIRFGHTLVDRLFLLIQTGAVSAKQRSVRLALRFSTVSRVAKNVIATLLIAAGILIGLSLLGFDLGPLLAGAGILSLAVSFASQNVIKDVINGFLILLEDQFGVGDVIVVGDVAGFVENMNLRITQLRNEEGRLITIPNGQIGVIQNLSKEWSRVDLLIPVALSSDIDRAIDLIGEVAEEMRHDQQWSSLILEPALVLGVDHLDHVGATVRIWIMTLPLKQWDVAREYRRRLKLAFDQANIDIGVPQQSLMVHQRQRSMNGGQIPVY